MAAIQQAKLNLSNTPRDVREILSNLHKLIRQGRFIRGSLVYLRNKCGKSNCRCYKGEPHISLYIRKSQNGKPKMKIIPKAKWDQVREMNSRYKEILALLDEVSDYEWQSIKDKDKNRD